jgi:hypothetical protein
MCGFQHPGRLHAQIRERAHARRTYEDGGGAVTAATLASAAGGGSCEVTSADIHLGLAEADRGSLSAYGSDLLSSPLPSSARSGSSQDTTIVHRPCIDHACACACTCTCTMHIQAYTMHAPCMHHAPCRTWLTPPTWGNHAASSPRPRSTAEAGATAIAPPAAPPPAAPLAAPPAASASPRVVSAVPRAAARAVVRASSRGRPCSRSASRRRSSWDGSRAGSETSSASIGRMSHVASWPALVACLPYACLPYACLPYACLPSWERHSLHPPPPGSGTVGTVGSGWRRALWRGGRIASSLTRGGGTATGLGPKVADSEVFGLQARKQAHPPAEGELARVPAHAPRAQACVAAAPPPRHVVRKPRRGGIQVIPRPLLSRPLLSQEQRGVAVGGGWGGQQPQQHACVARRDGQRRSKAVQGLTRLKSRYFAGPQSFIPEMSKPKTGMALTNALPKSSPLRLKRLPEGGGGFGWSQSPGSHTLSSSQGGTSSERRGRRGASSGGPPSEQWTQPPA